MKKVFLAFSLLAFSGLPQDSPKNYVNPHESATQPASPDPLALERWFVGDWICSGIQHSSQTASGVKFTDRFHFRMALGDAEGRHDAMLWSLSGGQPIDMIRGALSNLRNIALHLPGPYLITYSPINRYASNTVNVWMNSAAYAGVSKLLLGAVTLVLLTIACYCLIALRRIIRRSSEMESLSSHKA